MYTIAYTSVVGKIRDITIKDILRSSRKNNGKRSVSGLLMIKGGLAFQVLEGEKQDVLSTFKAIAKDSRHNSVRLLFEGDVGSDRLFPKWQMGFLDGKLDDQGKTELRDRLFELSEGELPSRDMVLTLLQEFANSIPDSAADILAKAE